MSTIRHAIADTIDCNNTPTRWDWSQDGRNEHAILAPWKSKIHKPFSIECAGHPLQKLDPLLIVLDGMLVCRQHCGDASLRHDRRQYNLHTTSRPNIEMLLGRPYEISSD